jgi:hypothetical protein
MSEVASIDETAFAEDCSDNQAIDHFINRKLQIEQKCSLVEERGHVAAVVFAQ